MQVFVHMYCGIEMLSVPDCQDPEHILFMHHSFNELMCPYYGNGLVSKHSDYVNFLGEF